MFSYFHTPLLALTPLQRGHLTKVGQGSTLAGTGVALLGPSVPSHRQGTPPLCPSSLWLGKETPHVSTGGPHLPSLLIFPFISVPLLRRSLSFACCLRPALPFPQPPPPSWLPRPVLATPSQPSRPATPQNPLSRLGPSVLTLACQLALRSESKSKAVCCEKMEKW